MKDIDLRCLVAVSMLLSSAGLIAQETGEDQPVAKPGAASEQVTEQENRRDVRYLPKPLSAIKTNILDLERSGYFAIDEVAIRTRANGDEAIVWTVRVKRAVTCRHTEAMLREFRDVRFYATIEKRRLEVIATLMHYSDRITLGTSSNRLLGQDDVFELWIDLPTTYLQKLVSRHADAMALRRWRY